MFRSSILFFFIWFSFITLSWGRNGLYTTLEAGGACHPLGLSPLEQLGAMKKSQKGLGVLRVGIGYSHDIASFMGIGGDIGIGNFGKEHYPFVGEELTIFSRTLEFSLLSNLHIGRNDIIGKVGALRHTIVVSNGIDKREETKIKPHFSLGTAFNFNPHLALLINYAHIFDSPYTRLKEPKFKITRSSMNELLIGIRYSF